VNAEYSRSWPNIATKGEPPSDAKEMQGVPDKFEKFFSDKPGSGS
jgi:ferredoxin